MARFTRGFGGRARGERDPRLPPGQYDTGNNWPGAHRGGHAPARHRDVDLHDRRARRSADDVDVGRDPRAARRRRTRATSTASRRGRSSASHFSGVSVDTLLDVAGVQPERDARARVLAHRVHDEPSARRRDRRARRGSCGTTRASRSNPRTADRPACSCRTSTSGRARSSSRVCACSITTNPASGSRTATTTGATRGSSSATRVTEESPRPA